MTAATTAATATPAAATASAAAAATGTTASSASTTGELDVRVADDEAAAHEALNVVDLCAFHEGSAFGIDQNSEVLNVHDEVVILRLFFDAHRILKSTVRARHRHDSQQCTCLSLFLEGVLELLAARGVMSTIWVVVAKEWTSGA